jgi:hypothetical protein
MIPAKSQPHTSTFGRIADRPGNFDCVCGDGGFSTRWWIRWVSACSVVESEVIVRQQSRGTLLRLHMGSYVTLWNTILDEAVMVHVWRHWNMSMIPQYVLLEVVLKFDGSNNYF